MVKGGKVTHPLASYHALLQVFLPKPIPCQSTSQIDWHAWFSVRAWRTVLLGLVCWILRQHIFWHAQWDRRNLDMDAGKEKAEVNYSNYIPVDKDKLKDEHKEELRKAMELYEQECLKAFTAIRSDEVVKKFNLPDVQSLTEVQMW